MDDIPSGIWRIGLLQGRGEGKRARTRDEDIWKKRGLSCTTKRRQKKNKNAKVMMHKQAEKVINTGIMLALGNSTGRIGKGEGPEETKR